MYDRIRMISIIYYSNNKLDSKIKNITCSILKGIEQRGAELLSITKLPMELGRNFISPYENIGHRSIYSQILLGLEYCTHDIVFLAEHDVLYPLDHFNLRPTDTILYNSHVYHMSKEGFFEAPPVNFLSTLVAPKELLKNAITKKLVELDEGKLIWAEPEENVQRIRGKSPVIDIRHDSNFTGSRVNDTYLDTIDYWGSFRTYRYLFEV